MINLYPDVHERQYHPDLPSVIDQRLMLTELKGANAFADMTPFLRQQED